ncbi:MAG TPA: hypothetical protein VME43_10090 [Bryobacteraceae bacterium]|nr:hypothetical protein [Bryobacteraceae bacterium]
MGALEQIPRDLWSNVTKFLSPQDIARLKQTGATVNAEIEAVKVAVTAEKWKAKLAKLEALCVEIRDRNIKMNELAKQVERLPFLGQQHLKIIGGFMRDELPVYEQTVKAAKDKIGKLKLRKTLTDHQTGELDAFVKRLTIAEATHESMIKKVMAVVDQKPKK